MHLGKSGLEHPWDNKFHGFVCSPSHGCFQSVFEMYFGCIFFLVRSHFIHVWKNVGMENKTRRDRTCPRLLASPVELNGDFQCLAFGQTFFPLCWLSSCWTGRHCARPQKESEIRKYFQDFALLLLWYTLPPLEQLIIWVEKWQFLQLLMLQVFGTTFPLSCL